MRAIRVTVDRRAEGIRVAVAMSPSVLKELVEYDGEAHFNSITDEDLVLDLDLEVGGPFDPEEPEDEFVRMEFEREAEEYESISEGG
jgi:hypothetical protein